MIQLEAPSVFYDISNNLLVPGLNWYATRPYFGAGYASPFANRRGYVPNQKAPTKQQGQKRRPAAVDAASETKLTKIKPAEPEPGRFTATFDVTNFEPSELSVKVDGNLLIVEGKRQKTGTDGHLETYFRSVPLPENCLTEQLKCTLDSKGKLRFDAPLKTVQKAKADPKQEEQAKLEPLSVTQKEKTDPKQEEHAKVEQPKAAETQMDCDVIIEDIGPEY